MFSSHKYSFAWLSLMILSFCHGLTSSAQVVISPQIGPIIRSDVHHDVSLPFRDLAKLPPTTSVIRSEVDTMRRIPLPPGLSTLAEDPIRQHMATATLAAPTFSQSFDGIGQGQFGFTVNSAPPDTNGTVGATQYVQWVNSSFAVFNKSTGALILGSTAGNSLWSGFGGGCQTNNDGDPIVLYDKLANRWVLTQFSVSTTPFLQCVAVSTTSDATGTYNRYSFQYSGFDDYPKVGVWPDAYYVTFNMFNNTTNAFLGADACAYDRTAMLNGQPATQVCFQQTSSVGGLLPADLDGTTPPPAGSPNYMMFFGTNSLNLFKFHVNFATPANSTFTGPTSIPVAAFSPLCGGGTCVPQPGTTNQLDSLADRLMYRLAYRNFTSHESLVVNHSVTVSSGGGLRWYEIQNPNGTPTVAQQGTFAPDSSFRWMGSMAMDKAGDIALGYSVSSSTVRPSVAFTGRTPSDPAGTMETETIAVTGAGSQTGTLTRWGDYSAMQVDPSDDCTFWYTQEYLKASGTFNWNTRIVNFKFPNCGGTADFALSAAPSSLSVVQGTSGTSTITISPLNGFSGSTALSASGLPAGVTATFNPASATTTSTLTFSAGAAATTGTSTVTVLGTSGSLSHTTSIALTVTSPVAGPSASLSPTSLSFASRSVGTTSAAQAVTLTNNGPGTLTISSIVASGDFAQTNNCGTSQAVGGSCTINVTFTPAAAGTRTGTLTVSNNASNSPQTASLTGTGIAGTAQQLLGNPGFENGTTTAPWTLTAGVINNSSGQPPHSGTWDAWLDGYGTTHTDSATQTVSIPSTVTSATLSFWLHIDTAETTTTTAFDTLQVQVLNSAGTTVLATLGTFSNLNHATGYQQHSFTLGSQFIGQTVRIRFLGTEDSSLQTSFVIDDTALNVQ